MKRVYARICLYRLISNSKDVVAMGNVQQLGFSVRVDFDERELQNFFTKP
jgi:hypothetical protein